MKTQKLLIVLASAALGLGLAGCAGNADASAPTYKVPTIAQMDKEKQVLNAERKDKAAKEYAAKVKAEKEAKAKAEAEAAAAAQAQAQAGSGTAARSGTSARSYQPKARSNYRQGARHNYRQGKARGSYNYKARPRGRRGGGGGLSYDDIRRRSAELDRAELARNANKPKDNKVLCTCVGGSCDCH